VITHRRARSCNSLLRIRSQGRWHTAGSFVSLDRIHPALACRRARNGKDSRGPTIKSCDLRRGFAFHLPHDQNRQVEQTPCSDELRENGFRQGNQDPIAISILLGPQQYLSRSLDPFALRMFRARLCCRSLLSTHRPPAMGNGRRTFHTRPWSTCSREFDCIHSLVLTERRVCLARKMRRNAVGFLIPDQAWVDDSEYATDAYGMSDAV
jgi:hypothetical protein